MPHVAERDLLVNSLDRHRCGINCRTEKTRVLSSDSICSVSDVLLCLRAFASQPHNNSSQFQLNRRFSNALVTSVVPSGEQ